jgi:hypothetical protein
MHYAEVFVVYIVHNVIVAALESALLHGPIPMTCVESVEPVS